MTLGDRIKSTRSSKGLKQSELARLCGIAGASLSQLENGTSESMRQETLIRMSKELECTPAWLAYGDAGEPSPRKTAQYSASEISLVEDFRRLASAEKKVVLQMVRALGRR